MAVESLVDGCSFVGLGHQQVDKSDEGALELCAVFGFDGDGTEGLPDYALGDIDGYEEGDA